MTASIESVVAEGLTLPELLARRQMVRVTQIRADGGTQMRAALNQETVADYADIIYRQERTLDWPFPALVLFYDGSDYWLADGFHRLAAFVKTHDIAGNPDVTHTLPCLVHPGTRRDAILYAAAANATHGLRRTHADKRRSVETLLRDDEWRQWSDREIARRCGVDHAFVGKLRAELTGDNHQSPDDTLRKGGDGRVINTAKIGTNPPRRDPEPRPARPLPAPAAARTVYVPPETPARAAAPDIYAPGYKPTAGELLDDYERAEICAEIAANAPATLDDLPLVVSETFPGLTAAEKSDRRRTYAWLRTIYAEARDGLRMYEEMTGDFSSRGPLLRIVEPMIATINRHIAAYEHGEAT